MDRKEELLKTFEGQIFATSIDYIEGLGLKKKVISPTALQTSVSKETPAINQIEQVDTIEPVLTEVEESTPKNFELELLFIGERPADYVEESGDDLLSKMIDALQIDQQKLSKILLVREAGDNLDRINQSLENKAPRAIVTLGAYATNLLMDKKTKLSSVHGQEQKYNLKGVNYTFFPIFHPDYLNINPNMKRTAWNDLKLVLEYLGKATD